MHIWVNFRELREKLKFEDVLRHYGVEISRKGEQHQSACPLPGHKGKDKQRAFSANLTRGIFQCFGCGAKGNVLEFACLMSQLDPSNGDALRKVAIELQTKLFPSSGCSKQQTSQRSAPTRTNSPAVVVNAPLDFELKGLEHNHPYLTGRGFDVNTALTFGFGFCSRGLLKNRIAIPLHDPEGKLIGYAGRTADDALISEAHPKYLFPATRERHGARLEFRKSLFVYNGHRLQAPCEDLIVVQGFTSVWWLHQHGYENVVALMGSECSNEQANLIVSHVAPTGHIWILPDGDDEGVGFAHSLFATVAVRRFTRWVPLKARCTPTDLSLDDVQKSFSQ